MSRTDDRREYDRISYERDRDRIRFEDDEELDYTTSTRRPAPPPSGRPRSPAPPLAPGRSSERTFEDEERFLRERRYFDERDDRGRPHPPPVISGDPPGRTRRDDYSPPPMPPPGRPGHLVRRQSSLDTFDRRPARRAYDYDRVVDDPRDRSMERTSERFTERNTGRYRETDFASEFDELRIDSSSGRYRPAPVPTPALSDIYPLPHRADDRERDYYRETELVRTRREEESRGRSRSRSRSRGPDDQDTDEYPKKGKTRFPARLVSERALTDLNYPFVREGSTVVVQLALGQDNINDVLRLSKDYKKSEKEIVEYKKTKVKTSSGMEVAKSERRREEYYMTPAVHQQAPPPLPPPPVPAAPVYYQAPPPPPPPPPAPAAPVYEYVPAPVYEPAHDSSVAIRGTAGDYTTTVEIRDVSPTRQYPSTSNYYPAPVTSTELVRTQPYSRPPPPVIVDAGDPAPALDYRPDYRPDYRDDTSVGSLAVVAVNDHHRRRSRHSRSHSHEDGALYAHIHDRHDRHDHGYYYKHKHEYYESPRRELVRAERTSNGELIVYEDDIEVEVKRPVVRIEKDKKGRMSISVPKYRR